MPISVLLWLCTTFVLFIDFSAFSSSCLLHSFNCISLLVNFLYVVRVHTSIVIDSITSAAQSRERSQPLLYVIFRMTPSIKIFACLVAESYVPATCVHFSFCTLCAI